MIQNKVTVFLIVCLAVAMFANVAMADPCNCYFCCIAGSEKDILECFTLK